MKTFVINLKECPERWEKAEKHLLEYGFKPERFEAIRHEIGSYGCSLSHNAIIKMAKEKGWQEVMVFEDDICFLYPKKEIWKQIKRLNMVKADVVYLGANFAWDTECEYIQRKYWIEIKKCLGRFAVIYRESCYDWLLDHMPSFEQFMASREVRGDVLLGASPLKKIGVMVAGVDSRETYTGTKACSTTKPLDSGQSHFHLVVSAYVKHEFIEKDHWAIDRLFDPVHDIYKAKVHKVIEECLNPFLEISGVLYINLDRDKERRKLMEKEMERIGIPAQRFKAIQNKNGWAGSTLSHRRCVEIAKEKGWKNVLIFEDDIFFIKDKMQTYKELRKALKKECDILYLGLTVDTEQEPEEDIYRVNGGWGLYAYIVNKSCYDKILGLMPDDPEKISQKERTVSDVVVRDHIHPEGKCLLVPLCSARDGYSHNWEKVRKGLSDKIVDGYRKFLKGFRGNSVAKYVITKGGERLQDFRKQGQKAKEIAPVWGTIEVQEAVDRAQEQGQTDPKRLLKIAKEASNRLTFAKILKESVASHTIIFEDDCVLEWKIDIKELPENYDIVLIGAYFRGGELETIKDGMWKIKKGVIWGCHAVVFSEAVAKEIVKDLEKGDLITDKYVSSLCEKYNVYMMQKAWQKHYGDAVHGVNLEKAKKYSEQKIEEATQ